MGQVGGRDLYELAWAAGFFDGEGCSYLSKRVGTVWGAYSMPIIAVGQTDPRPLERMQAALGVGRIDGPRRNGKRPRKLIWTYRIAPWRDVQWAFCQMWPWLCEPKRAQALGVWREARTHIIRMRLCVNGHDPSLRGGPQNLCRVCRRERKYQLRRDACPKCGQLKTNVASQCRACWLAA